MSETDRGTELRVVDAHVKCVNRHASDVCHYGPALDLYDSGYGAGHNRRGLGNRAIFERQAIVGLPDLTRFQAALKGQTQRDGGAGQ